MTGNIIERMHEVRRLDREISRCQDLLSLCDSRKYRCTSGSGTSPGGGARRDILDTLQEEDELKERISQLHARRSELVMSISSDPANDMISAEEQRVLTMYHMAGYSLRRIADELFISKSAAHRHLKAAEKILGQNGTEWDTLGH